MTEDEQKRAAELLRSVRVLSSEDHVHDLVEIQKPTDQERHAGLIQHRGKRSNRSSALVWRRLVDLLSTAQPG